MSWFAEKVEPRLVQNWREAKKWFSMWAMGVAFAVCAAWIAVPDDLKHAVPDNYKFGAVCVLMVLGVGGRMTKQGGSDAGDTRGGA